MGEHTITLDDVDEALVDAVAPDGVDTDDWLAAVVVQHAAQAHAQDKAATLQRGAQRPDVDDLLASQDQMPTPDDPQDGSGGDQDPQEADD